MQCLTLFFKKKKHMLQSTVGTFAALALWYAAKYLILTKPSNFTWLKVLQALKPCLSVFLALSVAVFLYRYNDCNHQIKTMASALVIVAAVSCAIDIGRGSHTRELYRGVLPGHAACMAVLMYLAAASILASPVNACSVATSLSSVACIAILVAAAL